MLSRWEQYLHRAGVNPQNTWGNADQEFIVHLIQDHCRWLKPGARILDVGCADGYLMHLLAQQGYTVQGITYLAAEREAALSHDPRLQDAIAVGDMHDLPYDDQLFDLAISRQTLEHALAPVVCLWELHRVVKAEGKLLEHVPHTPSGLEDDTNPTHHYCLQPEQWLNLLWRNGWSSEIHGVDDMFGGFWVIAGRKPRIPLVR
jgi:SAM-dependent methyltransferase